MSSRSIPDYPENIAEGVKALQQFGLEGDKAKLYSKSYQYSDLNDIVRALHTQVAKLGQRAATTQTLHRDRKPIEPTSEYASDVAETMYLLISLANSKYVPLDLAAALEEQAKKHVTNEAEAEKRTKKREKKAEKLRPKYHAKGSGLNPYRKDGLYGKAAAAADGDWYSSH